MANLNGHEVGNDGYSQEEPVATAPEFYSTKRALPRKHEKEHEDTEMAIEFEELSNRVIKSVRQGGKCIKN